MAASGPEKLTPSRPLDYDHEDFFSTLEQSFAVRLIQTEKDDIKTCSLEAKLEIVFADEQLVEFDHVPVEQDGEIIGLLYKTDVRHNRSLTNTTMKDHYRPLHPAFIISENAPLLDFIGSADTEPCKLLIGKQGVSGMVTISDLQKLPIQTAVFALIVHIEHVVSERLRAADLNALSVLSLNLDRATIKDIERRLKRLEDQDLALDVVSALHLSEKLQIAQYHRLVSLQDGVTKRINQLRNDLVHGHEYASTRANVERLSQTVRELQFFLMYRDPE